MSIQLIKDSGVFDNPECLPLENLKFKIVTEGVTKDVKAFSKYWLEGRFHTRYPGEPKSGSIEEEQWLSNMSWFNKELEWMLNLEHFRFWSNMVYDSGCIASLVSFLQEAPPFYCTFVHRNPLIMDAYALAYQRVLQIFCRMITNKENEKSWMGKQFLGTLLYEHSLITIPILWDITAIYGENNSAVLSRFMDTVFRIQPKYHDDLEIAYKFLKEKVFVTIEQQSGGFTAMSPSSSIEKYNTEPKPNENVLADLALHLLDCATTMRHFLEVYPPAKIICRNIRLCTSIAHLYDNCIPALYNKFDNQNNSTILDNARVELLECYRLMISTCIEEALTDPPNAILPAELFLELLSETLNVLNNQKAFVEDLLSKQPLQNDLEHLRMICNDLDPVKCDFILQSLMSSVDDFDQTPSSVQQNHFNASPSRDDITTINYEDQGACHSNGINESSLNASMNEVLDVFPHLGRGYITRLLDYYGSSQLVITAVLEDHMPDDLNCLDKTEPSIPPDPLDELYSKMGNARLNVFDGDELDIRIRDVPKEHWQNKNKRGPKNLNELLNDKSHIKEIKSKYQEYSLVYDNVYDDEYDDSYEGPTKPVIEEGSENNFRRPTEVPRVLRTREASESDSEPEQQEETRNATATPTKFQPFCENPEVIRARRDALRNNKMPGRDVIGKPKGQGQEKDVAIHRDKKNTNKSSRANHNRRQGAQWKRSRGMMPS